MLLLYALFAVVIALALVYAALIVFTPRHVPLTKEEYTFSTPSDPSPQPLPSLLDKPSLDLSIVVPAFNESKRLPAMLADTLAHLTAPSTPRRSVEIIVVDDGSSDDTHSTALKLGSTFPKSIEMRAVRLKKNRGKGGAVQMGLLGARGKRILMVDADGASKFSDIESLWKEMDTLEAVKGSVIAIGSRAHLVKTEAVVKRSRLRNFLMYSFHFLLRMVGVSEIRDTQCGFKLFSRSSLLSIAPTMHLQTWLFDVEVLLLASMVRPVMSIVEVPIQWHEVDGSKLSVIRDSIGMARDVVVLRANYVLGRWKVSDGEYDGRNYLRLAGSVYTNGSSKK